MKPLLIILLALLFVGCATERKPNPFDAPQSDYRFDDSSGQWEQTP